MEDDEEEQWKANDATLGSNNWLIRGIYRNTISVQSQGKQRRGRGRTK